MRKLEYGEWLVEQQEEQALKDAQHTMLVEWHATQCQHIYRFYQSMLNEENRIWFHQAANEISHKNVGANRVYTLRFMEQEKIRRLREDAASVIIQAYWRRKMAKCLFLTMLMARDACATLLQSQWRRAVGLKKSKSMADYWQRMKEWTLEQEYNATAEGKGEVVEYRSWNV